MSASHLGPGQRVVNLFVRTATAIKEDERIQTWGLGYTAALNNLNNLGLTSTFNAGPMTVRVSGQVI